MALRHALLTVALLMLAQTADAQRGPDRVVPYKTVGDVELALHVFQPESPEGKRPAVVFFHGGGWNSGTPDQFHRQARHLATRGLVGISVEYRLKNTHGTTPLDAIRDAFDAMRFVRDNAADLGIESTRIAAAGGSAGGHLAAATATLVTPDLAGDPDAAARARPNALILFNPVSDNGPGQVGHDRLGNRWRDASPAHHLSAKTPPTLYMIGDSDQLITVETAQRFAKQLEDAGVKHRLIVYENAGHGWFNRGGGPGSPYGQTLAELERFLGDLGWL